MPIELPPTPDLVDPLGVPLRAEPLGTFSNHPSAMPDVTLEQLARTAYETRAFMFRTRSRWWFQDAGWRRWQELSHAQQEQALAAFRKPPPLEDYGEPLPPLVYAGKLRVSRPVYAIADLGAVEIAGAPYGDPPYRRCAACGQAKRTGKRQRWPYCSRCVT
jgi:hypothetical protein